MQPKLLLQAAVLSRSHILGCVEQLVQGQRKLEKTLTEGALRGWGLVGASGMHSFLCRPHEKALNGATSAAAGGSGGVIHPDNHSVRAN